MDEKKEILLKEYEACQQDNQAQASRYWTILGIFISINTPIIGGLAVVLFSTDLIKEISNIASFWIKLFILLISLVGIYTITRFLELSLDRAYYIVQNNNRRMLEIEIELGIWKELPIIILDKWNTVREEPKYKDKPCNSQNAEIWVRVWRELSTELSKDHFDSLYEEKSRVEEMSYQKRFVYVKRMEYKAAYVFLGIFSLWGILIAYLLQLSLYSLLYPLLTNWVCLLLSYMLYILVLIVIGRDFRNLRKKEHSLDQTI